jgi:hypothetical protein
MSPVTSETEELLRRLHPTATGSGSPTSPTHRGANVARRASALAVPSPGTDAASAELRQQSRRPPRSNRRSEPPAIFFLIVPMVSLSLHLSLPFSPLLPFLSFRQPSVLDGTVPITHL